MKNKILIICTIILFSLTSACSCSHKKTIDENKTKKIGDFEVIENKTENVDGTLKLNLELKNVSKKTKKIPLFYVSLINKDHLEILSIENAGGQKVDKNMSINFEINTGVQYSVVKKIEYKTTEKKQDF